MRKSEYTTEETVLESHKKFIVELISPNGFISKHLGLYQTAEIKGVYYIPRGLNTKTQNGPISVDLKEKVIYFNDAITHYSEQGIIGLVLHELGHLIISPKDYQMVQQLYKDINVHSYIQKKILRFTINFVTDYEVESYQINTYEGLKQYKRQQFIESHGLRKKLKESLNIKEQSIVNQLLDSILLNYSVYFESEINYMELDPDLHEVVSHLKHILDSAMITKNKILDIYNYITNLEPPKAEDPEFMQKLRKYLKLFKIFPFLRGKMKSVLHDKTCRESLPKKYRDFIEMINNMKYRNTSPVNKTRAREKEPLVDDEEIRDITEMVKKIGKIYVDPIDEENNELLDDLIPIILLDTNYSEKIPPAFEISEEIKSVANPNRKSKLDEDIEEKLDNAGILLEEAELTNEGRENKSKVGIIQTRNIHELIQNFGMNVLFSFFSQFKAPFYKDLIEYDPTIDDTFLIEMDISGSMSETQLDSCKTICTALIQHAVKHHLEIGIIPFESFTEPLLNEEGSLFWDKNFYELLKGLMQLRPKGGTSFNNAFKLASNEIITFQKEFSNQIRFLFLTDGIANISEDTKDLLKKIDAKRVRSLIIYIGASHNEMPEVLKEISSILSAKLLRTEVSKDGSVKIIREFLK